MSQIFELEEVLEQPEDMQKGFSIKDDVVADWAVKKIAVEHAELERLKAIAEQQIEEINMKIKHEEEVVNRRTSFLKGCLNQYFHSVPHKATKTQESYKLLSGSLVMKLGSQKMIKDDAELVTYFHQNHPYSTIYLLPVSNLLPYRHLNYNNTIYNSADTNL